jgi:exonuclease VII small subunit
MQKAINQLEQSLVKRLENAGINGDELLNRWEEGIQHHPKAEVMARLIGAVDWLFVEDHFGWKFGGDGDSGEALAYELDLIFELLDKEEQGQEMITVNRHQYEKDMANLNELIKVAINCKLMHSNWVEDEEE